MLVDEGGRGEGDVPHWPHRPQDVGNTHGLVIRALRKVVEIVILAQDTVSLQEKRSTDDMWNEAERRDERANHEFPVMPVIADIVDCVSKAPVAAVVCNGGADDDDDFKKDVDDAVEEGLEPGSAPSHKTVSPA